MSPRVCFGKVETCGADRGREAVYAAEEAAFGSRNAGDLPVDAHELIALCAPRPTFISYGIPERGDAKWLDQQGSFMAAVAAQPVFRLLGARGLGRSVVRGPAGQPSRGSGRKSGKPETSRKGRGQGFRRRLPAPPAPRG